MSDAARLQTAVDEMKRNLHHLERYAARVRELREQTPHALADPTDSEIESIDLFVLRFLKLVDASTRRLFPAVLNHLGEYDEGMPLIDVLNRWKNWAGF